MLVYPMKSIGEDQIHIEQLEIWSRVGVSHQERQKLQQLILNVTLSLCGRIEELGDDVLKTADYVAVCEQIKKFVQNREDRLIETLADAVAGFLLKTFSVHQVRVELRKFVLPDAAYASVILTRVAAID